MEQLLIHDLPLGTLAALTRSGESQHRSAEDEARRILIDALRGEAITLVDLLGTDEGTEIEFESERRGLTARTAVL